MYICICADRWMDFVLFFHFWREGGSFFFMPTQCSQRCVWHQKVRPSLSIHKAIVEEECGARWLKVKDCGSLRVLLWERGSPPQCVAARQQL